MNNFRHIQASETPLFFQAITNGFAAATVIVAAFLTMLQFAAV